MQQLEIIRKEHNYLFIYLEEKGMIEILKDNRFTYRITVKKNGEAIVLICDCPGGTYHHKCFHASESSKNFDFHKIKKPRTYLQTLNEEFIKEKIDIKNRGLILVFGN